MTFQIIYSSVSSTPLQIEELEDILEEAQGNNPEHGITGALVYADGFFLQILEGDKRQVESLMKRISKDLRHETVSVLHAAEVGQPAFQDWKMAYVSATPEQVAQWSGLGSTAKLPEVWDSLRQDPTKVEKLRKSILDALVSS